MSTPRDATTAFARTLVDEWVRAGVTDAVIAPGSRSTPIVLALANEPRLRLHVFIDERSAAAFALGIGKVSGRPAVLCCTSGTAAALFHGAVLEAFYARVPMIVCTADRPPELQNVGASQTINQIGLYGDAVRGEFNSLPPEDLPNAPEEWRALGARVAALATGSPAGPVHLNLAFREPLVPTGAPLVPAPGRPDGKPWQLAEMVTEMSTEMSTGDLDSLARTAATQLAAADLTKGLLVLGTGARISPPTLARFLAETGVVAMADPLSNLRTTQSVISTYDALLRGDEFASSVTPSFIIQVGGPLTSKATNSWRARVASTGIPVWSIDPDGIWSDPDHVITERVSADPEIFFTAVLDARGFDSFDSSWSDRWQRADEQARIAIDTFCDTAAETSPPFEGRLARDVLAAVPDGTTFFVASSMPVRDLDSFSAPRAGVRVLANRGVSGIDGFVSTVLGGARAAGPVVALLGDLCFLHDSNGLLGAATRDLNVTLVVVDNNGGGIFSFLPQATVLDPATFETLFTTPVGVDIAALAEVHGLTATVVTEVGALVPTINAAIAAGGVRVVVVRTDPTTNVDRHREVWAAVAAAVKNS